MKTRCEHWSCWEQVSPPHLASQASALEGEGFVRTCTSPLEDLLPPAEATGPASVFSFCIFKKQTLFMVTQSAQAAIHTSVFNKPCSFVTKKQGCPSIPVPTLQGEQSGPSPPRGAALRLPPSTPRVSAAPPALASKVTAGGRFFPVPVPRGPRAPCPSQGWHGAFEALQQ